MQSRAIFMLFVALILGGVAAYLVNAQLQEKLSTATASEQVIQTRPVVVAKTNLEVGMRVSDVMLKVAQWPAETAPETAFKTIDEAVGKEPRVVLQEMVEGEVVLKHKLSMEGARGGLTPRIPPDMRAITISVNEIRGVAGFVLPGDHVDLMLTSTFQKKAKKLTTRTLMQNALVLGVAQEASQKKDDPRVVKSVTLLVTPKQSKKLILAQAIGTLTLVLRNESDTAVFTPDEVITFEELTGRSEVAKVPSIAPKPAPPPKPKAAPVKKKRVYRPPSGTRVDIIRGLDIQKQKIKSGG